MFANFGSLTEPTEKQLLVSSHLQRTHWEITTLIFQNVIQILQFNKQYENILSPFIHQFPRQQLVKVMN